jgi:hypothetical protein
MQDSKNHKTRVIDLGRASAETKGTALFDIDVSGGQLRYVPGALAE